MKQVSVACHWEFKSVGGDPLMNNLIDKNNASIRIWDALKRGAEEAKASQRAKRLAQHQHWMRVMMEGQATPNLAYQKPKT